MERRFNNNANTNKDTLNNVKLLCKSHNSDVGGVCDNYTCRNKLQLLCVKCVTESNSCIRQFKHNLVPLSEFVNTFFDFELQNLRKDFNYSKSFNTVEQYLANSKKIIADFEFQMNDTHNLVNEIYNSLIGKLTQSLEDFNISFKEFHIDKLKLIKDSLESLNDLTSYEILSSYNISNLKEKMSKMPFDNLNTSIVTMKRAINGIKNKLHIKPMEKIGQLTLINDEIVGKYKSSFEEIESAFQNVHNSLKCYLKDDMFKPEQKVQKSIEELQLQKEVAIDYSVNSNFYEKKFTIFEHTNGNTILAYPTSQNTIKLEIFDQLIVNTDTERGDKCLYFKLRSHGARITDLMYYRFSNCDILISSSEDKSIKIWDFTHLNKYLDNVNDYYKTNCVKTLLGHENRISCFDLFFDPLTSVQCLISIGYGDRIKVWNMATGDFIKNFHEATNYDSAIASFHNHTQQRNYVITANHNFSIRVWDFDTGKVIKLIKYPKSKIVSILEYNSNREEFLLIDENDKSGLLSFNSAKEIEFVSLNLDNFKADRVNASKWNESTFIFSSKNGKVYEYNLDKREFSGTLRTGSSSISHMMKYHYKEDDLVLTHSVDQKIKIFY